MALLKSSKLSNFYVFTLLLPLLIFASQAAFASPGDVHTYAGLGKAGFSGDGGQATAAFLKSPSCVATDAAGNLYISDRANQRIRKVDATGKISTIAGNGAAGYSGDGGSAILAKLKNPSGIAVDSAGDVLFADMGNNRIRKVSASGVITTVAGTGAAHFSGDGGPAAGAAINHAEGVAVDSNGNIYISDTGNNRIRMISTAGVINTVAGTGAAGFSGDGGPAISAKLNRPAGIALDAAGKLYVADCYNHSIRVIDLNGGITTLAGDGKPGFSGDGGSAVSASLKFPSGVAVNAAGDVYIADWHSQRVRVVDTSGTITTLAGTGVRGFSGDGAAAGDAVLSFPFGLTADSKGNIFIADSKNNRIRMVEGPSYPLPVSTITSPVSYGKAFSGDSGITVTGTASAAGGVSFVEVSTDGGATWGTASGTTTWNFGWKPQTKGAYLIMSRATDSSGAHETIISCAYVNVILRHNVPIAVQSFVPSLPAADPGQTVTWTATASGGSGNYQYQFLRKGPDTAGAYAVVQDWGNSNNWNWDIGSSSVGTNSVLVNVMDSSITTASASGKPASSNGKGSKSKTYTVRKTSAITISSITPSKASAVVGDTVTWTASAPPAGAGATCTSSCATGPDTGGTAAVAQSIRGFQYLVLGDGRGDGGQQHDIGLTSKIPTARARSQPRPRPIP